MSIKQGKASRKEFKKLKANGELTRVESRESIMEVDSEGNVTETTIHKTSKTYAAPEAETKPIPPNPAPDTRRRAVSSIAVATMYLNAIKYPFDTVAPTHLSKYFNGEIETPKTVNQELIDYFRTKHAHLFEASTYE